MKKLLLIAGVLLLLVGCGEKEENTTTHKYDFTVTPMDDCVAEAREYYQEGEITIYGVCVNDINVTDEQGNQKSLKEHMDSDDKAIDANIMEITSSLQLTSVLDDGGTRIYKNDNITVIRCGTTEGNNDVYIGNSTLNYQRNFCK